MGAGVDIHARGGALGGAVLRAAALPLCPVRRAGYPPPVRSIGFTLLALVACSPADQVVPMEHPPVPTGGSVVLGAEVGEQRLVWAVDPQHPAPVVLPASDEPVVLEAMVYDVPLDELGLTAGPLQSAAEPNVALPAGGVTFVATVEADATAAPAWQAVPNVPPMLSSLRIAAPPAPRCRPAAAQAYLLDRTHTLDRTEYEIRGDGMLVALGDGSALLSTVWGTLALLRVDGLTELPNPPAEVARMRSAIRAADGTLFIAGLEGEVWRATFDGLALSLTNVRSRDLAQGIGRWLVGGQTPGGIELYLLTHSERRSNDNSVHRFTGGAWTLVKRYSTHFRVGLNGFSYPGGLVWLGPGRVLASWYSRTSDQPDRIVLIDGNSANVDSSAPERQFLSAGTAHDGGALLATREGSVHHWHPDGTWSDLHDIEHSVLGIADDGAGYMYGGGGFSTSSWSTDSGVCPYTQHIAHHVHQVVELEPGVHALYGTPQDLQGAVISVIDRR